MNINLSKIFSNKKCFICHTFHTTLSIANDALTWTKWLHGLWTKINDVHSNYHLVQLLMIIKNEKIIAKYLAEISWEYYLLLHTFEK